MESDLTPEQDEYRTLEDPNDLGRRRITLLGMHYRLAIARYHHRREVNKPEVATPDVPHRTPQMADQPKLIIETPSLFHPIVIWLALVVLFNGLYALAQFEAISSTGTGVLLGPSAFVALPALGCFFIVPVAFIGLLFPRTRRLSFQALVFGFVCVMSLTVSVRVGHSIRTRAFHELAARSEVLVDAIKSYEQEVGQPPPNLGALVPEYLTTVPRTGLGAYPEYRYTTGKEARKYHDNTWVLSIFTPLGFLNFDQFLYFPEQNYPRWGYGGWLERVGDWAYVHE